MKWDRNKEGRHALQIEGGNVIVRGCEFQENKPQISLGQGVQRALITDNLFKGKLRVTNRTKSNVILSNNASEETKPEAGSP